MSTEKCPSCNETGVIWDDWMYGNCRTCPECAGKGIAEKITETDFGKQFKYEDFYKTVFGIVAIVFFISLPLALVASIVMTVLKIFPVPAWYLVIVYTFEVSIALTFVLARQLGKYDKIRDDAKWKTEIEKITKQLEAEEKQDE